nr:hypothetical protein [Tanacetum cinerariifolium]
MSIQDIEDLKQQYLDEMKSMINQIQIEDYRNERIDIDYRRECEIKIHELRENFNGMSIEINKKKELWQLEQAAKLSTYSTNDEDLVPIPSKSEDTSESDSDYDLSSCDDFSPIDVPEEKFVIFSNPLFDSNDDFTTSDDESLSDEDVPEDNVKIYSNPLFEFDDEYISITPLFDANDDECFGPGDDVDEIELPLHRDPSTPKMSLASNLEGFTNEPPLKENDDFFDLESKENKWKKILFDAPIDDLMTDDKVFDLRIHYRNKRIDIDYRRECEIKIHELRENFNGMSIEINKKKELWQLEQAAKLSTYSTKSLRRFNSFYDDDDDYEDSTIPLNEFASQIPSSIVITTSPLILPIEDPEDSLIMGNEELGSIPKKDSNEFIKSSDEDLVPIPSKSEDTSGSDSDYDLSSYDDFSPNDVPEEKFVIFSNPLFDSNDDFTTSDDESLSDEDVPEDNVKIYSNPLFEFDDEYISITPLFDANDDECFDPGDDVDEIELPLHRDPSTPKMSLASNLEGFTNEPPLKENDDLFDLESKENKWKKILFDAPIDDLMTEDKVFDIRIHSSFLLSSGSEDTVFDPGIFAFYFSLEPVASHQSGTFISFNVYPNILNESPIEIC